MAKIDKDSLSVFRNVDDLVDYIALHRFEPVNEGLIQSAEFKELPESIADIIHVLDFEMLFNAVGLFDMFANFSEDRIKMIINSLKRTDNNSIAELLQQAAEIVDSANLKYEQLHAELLKSLESEEEDMEETHIEVRISLNRIEEEIYNIMEELDYWESVKSKIQNLGANRERF